MAVKLGLMLGYSGRTISINMDMIREAEDMGYDSVWTAESWGSDAVSPAAWVGAQTSKIKIGTGIMQMPGRSPANTAMTAMTMDQLTGGRFILGLGTSGPQVVEGWHGVPWHKPLSWQREYISIVRTILRREEKLEHKGERYRIPYDGPNSAGLGKPLKSMIHGSPDLPIYSGSMAPKGQQLSGELFDGCLLTCMHPEYGDVIWENIRTGGEKAGRDLNPDNFDLAPMVAVVLGDDVEACRGPLKLQLSLYIGGMGSKNKNFYKEYLDKVGFAEQNQKIQGLFLEGKQGEAANEVTDEMIDTLYLVGPKERIRDRFEVWKEAPVGTIMIGAMQPVAVRLMAELNS